MTALAVIAVPIFINKSDEAKRVAQQETVTTLEKQAQAYMWETGTPSATGDILPDRPSK